MRVVARLIAAMACAAGLVACSNSTGGSEFPRLAHGIIEGTVVGTEGQPLDSVHVDYAAQLPLAEVYTFGSGNDDTGADGRFSLPVSIYGGPEPMPDTIEVFVHVLAEPPKYPAPPGEDNTVVSVLVTVALGPGDEPPPVVEATVQLPFPE